MSVKRWVSRYAAGTESYRELQEVPDGGERNHDEGPFYVLASDHEADLAAAERGNKIAHDLLVDESREWKRLHDEKCAEVKRLRSALDMIETIAVNDRTGCVTCSAVVGLAVAALEENAT